MRVRRRWEGLRWGAKAGKLPEQSMLQGKLTQLCCCRWHRSRPYMPLPPLAVHPRYRPRCMQEAPEMLVGHSLGAMLVPYVTPGKHVTRR